MIGKKKNKKDGETAEPGPLEQDSPPDLSPPPGPDDAQAHHQLPVRIHSQYIKDLSFENPNAPGVMRGGLGRPTMDVDFAMDARKVRIEDSEPFEVTLGVRVKATRGDMVAFIAEIEYAVLVSVGDKVPPGQVRPLLLIEIPRLAFPFVRQLIADLSQQAGFMPLLLAPVDFRSIYMKRFGGKDGAPPAEEPAKKPAKA